MITRIKYSAFIIFLLFNFSFAQSRQTLELDLVENNLPFGLIEKVPSNYPEVGIALSGGGARAVAQLGVLRALKENNIPIEYIVGTSMGSIIGGLYSVGYKLDELDSILVYTDWNSLISIEEATRKELFVDEKVTEDRAIFSIRFDGFKPIIPTALNSGQKVLNFLNLLALNAPIHVEDRFDNLLYNFRAVSTDLITGSTVVLDKGSLSRAMRASSSVSFLLAPVHQDSMLLVDGGLVANVPVNVAKELNCDYIIAVNTTSLLREESELIYPWTIADQLVSIPISILTNQHLVNANSIIQPYLGDHKNDDFNNLNELINLGYDAVRPHIKRIKENLTSNFRERFSDEETFYKNFKFQSGADSIDSFLSEKYLKEDSISSYQLYCDLYEFYASGDFKEVKSVITTYEDFTEINFLLQSNPKVENIELINVENIPIDLLYPKFKNLIYQPYNSRKILDTLLAVLTEYRKRGYSLTEIEKVIFDTTTKTLRVFVNEGIINEILVEGNQKTNSDVIKREIPVKVGKPLKYSELAEGLDKLRITSLFDEVDLSIENNGSGYNLIIKVIEKLSAVMRFGLKIDNEYYTQFLLDVRDENLFGTGSEIGAIFFAGPRNRQIIIEQKANRIFNTYLSYKVQGFYRSDDINTYGNDSLKTDSKFSRSRNGEYKQRSYGIAFSIGSQVETFGNLYVEARYSTDEIDNIFNTPVSEYTTNVAGLKFGMTIDSRNKLPYPSSGFFINSYYETAQTILGGDIGYTKFFFDYKSYFSLNQIHAFNAGVSLGFGDETLPLSQQFSFGGQDNFYGYKEYDLRGRQIFIASLEYQLKLPFQIFFDTYLSARYDLGSIWKEREQIKFENLRHGIGTTLSFDTPIGPADFSVGKSFLFKNTLPKSKISWGETTVYFTIGYYY